MDSTDKQVLEGSSRKRLRGLLPGTPRSLEGNEARGGEVSMKGVPEVLDKTVDAVLAYRPKPKSKAAKKRRRKAAKKTKG